MHKAAGCLSLRLRSREKRRGVPTDMSTTRSTSDDDEWTSSESDAVTQPDLSAMPLDLSDEKVDDLVLHYATYTTGEPLTQFWPKALQPQSWQECRLCHRELVGTDFMHLDHVQFRYIGARCRRRLIEGVEQFSEVLQVHKFIVLDVLMTLVRNLEAEERQAYGYMSGAPRTSGAPRKA